MQKDSDLMKEFLDGDEESFEKLVIKYRQNAISFAQRYTYDPFIAEEIVQESFASIYVYKEKYNSKYSFKTYLFTIVKNKSIDYLRKKSVIVTEDITAYDWNTPEHHLINSERQSIVRQKINELKEDYRTVIYLADYEEFSYKQIAKIMGKNLGQVKILLYRARKKLAKMLEGEV